MTMSPGARRRRAWELTVPDPDPPKVDRAPKPKNPVVYFFQTGEFIKIGKSDAWRERLSGLQTASPYRIDPLLVLRATPGLERQLHIQFKASHIRGEWFRPTADLMQFIEDNRHNSVAGEDAVDDL
ncbi:GIY-YIG nuclease family protein [Bradyrhizobium sp. Pa8]|uniref:GIY-YIG nuclease family protein n=1 Tax=Bradyrhizobium sp. Pa8 TaxID=3386552 RepID=UPI00403F2F55